MCCQCAEPVITRPGRTNRRRSRVRWILAEQKGGAELEFLRADPALPASVGSRSAGLLVFAARRGRYLGFVITTAVPGRAEAAGTAVVRRPGGASGPGPGGEGPAEWAGRTGRRQEAGPVRGGLRFAFYGRVSTEDWQDPVTSRARQLVQAQALVAEYVRITGEYFDAGQSRVLPWARRPQAAALVAAMADPGRGFYLLDVERHRHDKRGFVDSRGTAATSASSSPAWATCR
jgi:hypothetical protein